MTSLSIISTNEKIELESDKKNKNDNHCNNSVNSFKAFDSVLFMSEFLGKEENHTSEKSRKENENSENVSSNSYKGQNSPDSIDFKVSPSLEKCLTSELLDSITNDSNNIKKLKIQNFNNFNNQDGKENLSNEKTNILKITKKLFNNQNMPNNNSKTDNDKKMKQTKEKIGKTLYEETINGFEYQLKFIENSVHNILPKSYKTISNKNDNNNNSDKFKNINNYDSFYNKENNNYSNYYSSYGTYNKSNLTQNKNNSNNCDNNGLNEKQINHQIHKLKKMDNYYGDWFCDNCHYLNRGYRKTCINCSYY